MSIETALACCDLCSLERLSKKAKDGGAKLPRNWKRHQEKTWCSICWRKAYAIRAITMPVAGPVDLSWEELRPKLRAAWQLATAAANWAVQRLMSLDHLRRPEDEKLQPAPVVYLYPECRALFPALPTQTVCALLQTVERRWRARRWEVLWARSAAAPTYRYPMPFPVKNTNWHLEEYEQSVAVNTALLAQERVRLRLRGGLEFRRKLRFLDAILSGEALQGELSLSEQRVHSGDHRPALLGRAPGGGQKTAARLVAKVVAWFPKEARGELSGTLEVKTDPEHFWVATHADHDPWVLNGDHVRRWQREHNLVIERLAEDSKYEKRWPGKERLEIQEYRERRCGKNRRRLEAWCHDASALLVAYARRLKVAQVVYRDGEKGYMSHFPWCQLAEKLEYKLDAAGIKLQMVKERAAGGEDNVA